MDSTQTLRFVQLSDLHLEPEKEHSVHGFVPYENFLKVVEAVKALNPQPDFLLLTGDLANDKKPPVYEEVARVLSPLDIPFYWLPGNHDDPPSMQLVAEKSAAQMPVAFRKKGVQFILLNSLEKKFIHNHGELSPDDFFFLEESLKESRDVPCIIALHHHPLPMGFEWMDKSMLQEAEKFLALIQKYNQVKAVLFGHIHHASEKIIEGIQFMSGPSTAYHFKMQAEFAWAELGPGFRYLEISADGTIQTNVHYISP